MTELIMTPLDRTRAGLDVSATEAGAFRTCRRRWHLENIRNIEPKHTGMAFAFGTTIHAALEVYFENHDDREDRLTLAIDTFMDEWDLVRADAERDGAPPEYLDEMLEHRDLGVSMLTTHDAFDQVAPASLGRILAIEGVLQPGVQLSEGNDAYPADAAVTRHASGRMLVPIVNPYTQGLVTLEDADGVHVPHLSVRIDLLTERKTPKKGIWVIDHKTASKAPQDRVLDVDDQATAYDYAVWRWLGVMPRGVLFNHLLKKAPKEPRELKNGTLSTAKDQLTTPDMYRAAMLEHGIMDQRGNIDSDAHEECLNALLAHGWDRFNMRFEPTRNEAELMAYEQRLYETWLDLRVALDDERRRYPNPSQWNCGGCAMLRVCRAMDDGSDAEHIIETEYRVKEDRKA